MRRHAPQRTPRRTTKGGPRTRLAVALALAIGASGSLHGAVVALSLAANPDSYNVRHDTVLTVAAPGVLGNDVVLLGSSTAVRDSVPTHGSLALQSNGAFTYAPAAGYVGTDTFRYHAHDGLFNTGSTTVTITITNAAPVAQPDGYSVGSGVLLSVPAPGVLGNDTDADGDAMTASLVDGSGNGSLDLEPDGSFTFKSGGSFSGDRTFTYRVWDGFAWSATATVTIAVGAAATPKPTPAPTPTPRPTLRPTLPPLPPLPTLRPLPTLPLPRPSATVSPTPTPAPTRPGPSSTPSASSGPGGPVETPGSGEGPPQPGGDQGSGFTVTDGDSFGGFDGFGSVGLSGFDWAVPSLVISVPGLLLLLALAAQAGVGIFSLPFVRRWLGAFGLRRRRAAEAAAG